MRAQCRGSEPTSAARHRGHGHDACKTQGRGWLVTPVDVPQNDEAVGDAGDDQSNAAAADKQLWPGDENESSAQAAILRRRAEAPRGLEA
jgi:hypothetical protein